MPINKNSELALKFSSMLTNVWQLKVLPILIDYSDTTSVQVEFDKPYLVSVSNSFCSCYYVRCFFCRKVKESHWWNLIKTS